jgi:hypothetical protein
VVYFFRFGILYQEKSGNPGLDSGPEERFQSETACFCRNGNFFLHEWIFLKLTGFDESPKSRSI